MRLPGGAAAESEPGRSRAQDVNEQTARVRGRPVLEEVDALPRAEREAPGAHGNSEGGLGERCLDVRRHVVGPLGAVDEERIALGHESLEGEEVALRRGRRSPG